MTPDFKIGALVSYLSATCSQVVSQVTIENDLDAEIHEAAKKVHVVCQKFLKEYPGLKKGPKILKKYHVTYVELEAIARRHHNVELEPILNFYILPLEDVWYATLNQRKAYLINTAHTALVSLILVFDPDLEHTHHFDLAVAIYNDWQDMLKKF